MDYLLRLFKQSSKQLRVLILTFRRSLAYKHAGDFAEPRTEAAAAATEPASAAGAAAVGPEMAVAPAAAVTTPEHASARAAAVAAGPDMAAAAAPAPAA